MTSAAFRRRINLALLAALALNFTLWLGSSRFYAKWAGVPPAPTETGAVMATLGDRELSYRTHALTLQHLGDGGGQVTSLRDYDYGKLERWFNLLYGLNPASEHLPFVAALYFGGVTERPDSTRVVIDFLSRAGDSPFGEKWRWLAHASILARHQLKDLDLALDLAYRLSRLQLSDGREMPAWARQMPAFVLKAQGEKEASRHIMESMILTGKNLPPQEINAMASYLTDQLGVPQKEVDALLARREKE